MPKYISLMHRTDQGSKTFKDAPSRLDASRAMGQKYGCKIDQFYLSVGEYDQVAIIECPDDMAMAKFRQAVEAVGAIRMSTMRLFNESEYREIAAAI